MISNKSAAVVTLTCGALLLLSRPVMADQLIQNGGFETGDFTSWSSSTLGNGGFQIGDTLMPDGFGGFLSPGGGLSTVGPKSGSYYAVSDVSDPISGGPGARVLIQNFTTPSAFTTINLSYDMFVNDWNGYGALNTSGALDPTQLTPTQFARVDILTDVAGSFSTNSADIVDNLYLGEDAGNPPNAYASYSFDLTGILAPNTAYQLRFAEVDNQFVINQGVDNVSLLTNGGSLAGTPEPGSGITLAGLIVAYASLLLQRRRSGITDNSKQTTWTMHTAQSTRLNYQEILHEHRS